MAFAGPNMIDVFAASMVAAFALGYVGASPLFVVILMAIVVAGVVRYLATHDDLSEEI